MRILIASGQLPFSAQITDSLAEELRSTVVGAGYAADTVRIPCGAVESKRSINELMAARLLRFVHSPEDVLIALGYPAHLIQHPHKVIWLAELASPGPCGKALSGPLQQDLEAQNLRRDLESQAHAEAKKAFVVSTTLSDRWFEEFGVEAATLYPPPIINKLSGDAPDGDFILIPIERGVDNRMELLIEALRLAAPRVAIKFVGDGRHADIRRTFEARVASLGLRDQWQWSDTVSTVPPAELVKRSKAVLAVPRGAHNPQSAICAMHLGKPVITTVDSGAVAELVVHRENGWCVEPEPMRLAEVIDAAWCETDLAWKFGMSGKECLASMKVDWPRTLERLLG